MKKKSLYFSVILIWRYDGRHKKSKYQYQRDNLINYSFETELCANFTFVPQT